MKIDLKELETLARAATPGPWSTYDQTACNGDFSHVEITGADGTVIVSEDAGPSNNDSYFIAAANPAAVLELIALASAPPVQAQAPVAAMGDPLAVLTLGGIEGDEFDSWDLEVFSGNAIDKLQQQLVRSSEPVILNLYAAELSAPQQHAQAAQPFVSGAMQAMADTGLDVSVDGEKVQPRHAQAALSDEQTAFIKWIRDFDNIPDFVPDNTIMAGEITKHQFDAWKGCRAILATRQPEPVAAAVQGEGISSCAACGALDGERCRTRSDDQCDAGKHAAQPPADAAPAARQWSDEHGDHMHGKLPPLTVMFDASAVVPIPVPAQPAPVADAVLQSVPDGWRLVPKYENANAVVSALYRRFKEWSLRGFGPDDVTWCEVEADIAAFVAAQPPADAALVEAKALDVDALAQFIRMIDGNNRVGASSLAEKIIEWLAAQQSPAQGDADKDGNHADDLRHQLDELQAKCDHQENTFIACSLKLQQAEAALAQRAASAEAKPVAYISAESEFLLRDILARPENTSTTIRVHNRSDKYHGHTSAIYTAPPAPHVERDAALTTAVSAVLRDALDNVPVHVCDEKDDTIRAKGLHGPMADLYAAMAAQQGEKGGAA